MRNTMIMSVLFGFIPMFLLFEHHGNHALWFALMAFLACRGVFLAAAFMRLASGGGAKLLD
jgi:MATE family multidrug resistance protein